MASGSVSGDRWADEPVQPSAGRRPRGLLAVRDRHWRWLFAAALGALLFSCGGILAAWTPAPRPRARPTPPSPPPAVRRFSGLRERGEHLYVANGCFGCHGDRGAGGVPNPNSILGFVPALRAFADKVLLHDADERAWVLDRLVADRPVTERDARPHLRHPARFAVRYRMFRELIRKGNPSPSRHLDQPPPPLNMPPWAGRLEPRDIDALMAYLLSLSP